MARVSQFFDFSTNFISMTKRIKQRYCIKFCQKLGDTQVETIRKIQQAFGNEALSPTHIKQWFKCFKDGRASVESNPRSVRPSTSRKEEVMDQVCEKVLEDCHLTVQEIVAKVGISTGSVYSILTEDLNLRRVSAKFVLKLLTEQQKECWKEISEDMLDLANHDPEFIKTIITGDETWVYGYDPETKFQSSQWKHPESPRPKKAQQVCSNVKMMLICFFDSRGIVHHEYAPEGQTINKEYHLQVLCRLCEAVRRKWHNVWAAKNFQLHHDNGPIHSAHAIHAFLAKSSMPLVGQAPYSPDLAPCDFWLFPKLKTILKGRRFQSREDIMKKSMEELGSIPEEKFKIRFKKWQKLWEVCLPPRGIL